MGEQIIPVSLSVQGDTIKSHGDGELWRLSRLRWLNSRIGLNDEVARPFTPLELHGDTISCLGRRAHLGKNGFPERIVSFFDQNIRIGGAGKPILREAIEFILLGLDAPVPLSNFHKTDIQSAPGAYSYRTTGLGR